MSTPATVPQAFDRLFRILQAEHSEKTREAYGYDLDDFARWLSCYEANGKPDRNGACRALVMSGELHCADMVAQYMEHLMGLHRSTGTITRRVRCLGSVIRKARILGLCDFSLQIRPPKVRSYKDTRGPSLPAVAAMVKIAASQDNQARATRDVAMIRLLWELALRRNEVASLDLVHLDLNSAPARVFVLRKGRTEREWLTVGSHIVAALKAWVEHRGPKPGPVFTRIDNGQDEESPERLTGYSIWRIIRSYGLEAGIGRAWPHGLRHSSITHVLDRTNGDVRAAQRLSGHKKIDTLLIYDDNRQDIAGHLSAMLSVDLEGMLRNS